MIGVVTNEEEYDVVREFFELFKTPWEFYRSDGQYDVVLVAKEPVSPHEVIAAKLVVVYGSQETSFDDKEAIEPASHGNGRTLSYRDTPLPIYGKFVAFRERGVRFLTDQGCNQSVGELGKSGHQIVARIGYDLFDEICLLLTRGQPVEHAGSPTLEIHIALLRDLIVDAGIRLVEIPPIPVGCTFIACLTHDVDHPSIRLHKWDHTVLGFAYRAVVGSLLGVLRRRIPIRHLLANWVAVAKLPFVYLGLARDVWYDFDRYLDIEDGLDSTFFVLPWKGKPGQTASGEAPRIRAARYGAADLAERLQNFVSSGREIGLHGIDAWMDTESGRHEMAQITNIIGAKNIGVRMHWLYFDDSSPVALENAGFSYDSTVGYNETIGYRTGTTQVYKPLTARHLLELPLHVMDTALFYAGYLNCSFDEASKHVGKIINNAIRFGGTVTLNWHDRSIAPERLWGEFYTQLVGQLKVNGAWCASAGRTVTWFQQRRSIGFCEAGQVVQVTMSGPRQSLDELVPGFRVRVYNPCELSDGQSAPYSEAVFSTGMNIQLRAGSPAVFFQ